jgi:hypothetical protein
LPSNAVCSEKVQNRSLSSQGVRARDDGAGLLATNAAHFVLVVAKATGVGEEGLEGVVALGPVAKGAALEGQECVSE